MEGSRPYAAVRELEAALQFVSPLSQRGEDVCLPCAYEGIGQREKLRALYHKLRSSYDTTLKVKAVQMSLSFTI
jgi:hypothetical protein